MNMVSAMMSLIMIVVMVEVIESMSGMFGQRYDWTPTPGGLLPPSDGTNLTGQFSNITLAFS